MKQTLKALVLLIAGLILLTGTAAADAVPAYEIDVSNLKDDGTNYYIMAGTNLTIPVNLTYESDDAIGYMIIITNITQNEQQITSGLTYKYTLSSAVNADLAGAVNGKEYNYQFTGSETGMKGIFPSFVTIEVSGLTAGEQYDVQLEIYAGNTTHDFDKSVAALAKPFLSIGNQYGEGWFLTGEMVELIRAGVPNIVCIQPFACLPNHVTGKGMIKPLRKHNPLSNIAAIDYDPGASDVNQLNRIKPATVKGTYMKGITVSTTMGPGVKVTVE